MMADDPQDLADRARAAVLEALASVLPKGARVEVRVTLPGQADDARVTFGFARPAGAEEAMASFKERMASAVADKPVDPPVGGGADVPPDDTAIWLRRRWGKTAGMRARALAATGEYPTMTDEDVEKVRADLASVLAQEMPSRYARAAVYGPTDLDAFRGMLERAGVKPNEVYFDEVGRRGPRETIVYAGNGEDRFVFDADGFLTGVEIQGD